MSRADIRSAIRLVREARASCGRPHDEAMSEEDPQTWLDSLEKQHGELDDEDEDDDKYEAYLAELGDLYDELDQLEAVASDAEFMAAASAFGLEEHICAKLRATEAIRVVPSEKELTKACVVAASNITAGTVDYSKALSKAREIEGELDRLSSGKVRASIGYIALKGVKINLRKLSGMLG